MSTIFYDEITQVDYALIAPNGLPVGDSFRVSAQVSGNLNGDEQVVVDFSTFKKLAKQYIDDPDTGIDHKLWVYSGSEDHKDTVTTDLCIINTPDRSIYLINNIPPDCNKIEDFISQTREQVLEDISSELSNKLGYKIQLAINPQQFVMDDKNVSIVFRYVHGLPVSTSWGCQNNAHGHLACFSLGITDSTGKPHIGMAYSATRQLMCELSGLTATTLPRHVLPVIHLAGNKEGDVIGEYSLKLNTVTTSRGESSFEHRTDLLQATSYPEYDVYRIGVSHPYSVVILRNEPHTTVENITEALGRAVKRYLTNQGNYTFELSCYEGLSKGSIISGKT